MSLETGRVSDPIDLGDFGQALEPPAFAALAAELVDALAPLHPTLADAHAVLEADLALDLHDVADVGLADAHAELAQQLADNPAADDVAGVQAAWEDERLELAYYERTFPAGTVPGSVVVDRTNPPPGNRTPTPPRVTPQ